MEILDFGKTSDGVDTKLYILKNDTLECHVTDYGSNLVRLFVPDKVDVMTDIVLGYDNAAGYESDEHSLGANIGRCANRIGGASFTLDGRVYTLNNNDNGNCLHSGYRRYSKRLWHVENYTDTSITMSLYSPHMDQGFPGNLKLFVTYELKGNQLSITYEGTPDKDTIINITNHSYFNLNEEGIGDILDHKVMLFASHFTPADEHCIPTGIFEEIALTPMDFTLFKPIGLDIDADYEYMKYDAGYNHNFCIKGYDGSLKPAARVKSETTGIQMDIETDYPGLQFYTADYLDNIHGKNGHIYNGRSAVCFEPQFFPDAINRPEFESPICKAGETYCKHIVYTFSVL